MKFARLKFNVFALLPLLAAGVFAFGTAMAQEQAGPVDPAKVQREVAKSMARNPYENYLSFSYENDLIGDGTDRYYTSGVRLTYFNVNTVVPPIIDDIADAIPDFDTNATTGTYFTLGQNLYSPSEINSREPQEGDRPWAGWLYGSIGLATLTEDHVDDVELTLGVVGPEALGEQTQKFIHSHITGSPTPKGWSNQLDFEPGVILSWQRRWPQGPNGDWSVDFGNDFRLNLEPNFNVSLGNVYTYAGSGIMLTFGPYQDTLQDTPPRVKPALSGTGYFDVPDQDWSWYTFAGFDARAVGRNIFLDGNTFEDSASVDKKPLVGDAVAGVAFTLYDYRLSYTANYRTKEFDGQDEDTLFGSITLTSRF
jgi:lipid A 3-O-deacylase